MRFVPAAVRGEGFLAHWDARRAGRFLAGRGVRTAIFPAGYRYAQDLAAFGVERVSPLPLRRAAAGEILRFVLAREHYGDEVCLIARRVDEALTRTAVEAASRTRYLCLSLEESGEALCRMLRRDYGVAPRLCAPEELPREAVCLCFDRPRVPAPGPMLPLYDTAFLIDFAAPEELAAAAERYPELLPALYGAGALRPDALRVRRVGELV